MFRVDAKKPVHFCDGLTRRDFLHAGSLTALGLGLPAMQAMAPRGPSPRIATSTASCCSWSAGRRSSTPGT